VHEETQTWALTGAAPVSGGTPGTIAVYPATWTATSQGSTQRLLPTQKFAAQWKGASPPMANARIAVFVRASDQRLVIKTFHAALRAPSAVTGTRQVIVPGAAPVLSAVQSDAWEWPFPSIEDARDATDVAGSGTVVIAPSYLPMLVGGTSSNATCTWHFTKGTGATSSTPGNTSPSNVAPPGVLSASHLTPQAAMQFPSVKLTSVVGAVGAGLNTVGVQQPCNQVLTIGVQGTNTNFLSGVTTVDFGPGITVESVTVQNTTSLTAEVYIPPTAPAGAHTVTVATGGEVGTTSFTTSSSCAQAGANPNNVGFVSLHLSLAEGLQGTQNMKVGLTVQGGGFVWLAGVTTADFGRGITVTDVAVRPGGGADVTINIDAAAATGYRTITVTTANVKVEGGFTVIAAY
jgi:hypothetical protein